MFISIDRHQLSMTVSHPLKKIPGLVQWCVKYDSDPDNNKLYMIFDEENVHINGMTF